MDVRNYRLEISALALQGYRIQENVLMVVLQCLELFVSD